MPRPKVFAAEIHDGRGARLVGEGQAAAVAALTRRASQRGFAMRFPKADLQDQTLGGAQAVCAKMRPRCMARLRATATGVGRRDQRGVAAGMPMGADQGGAALQRWNATHSQCRPVASAAGADGAASALARMT